MAKNKEYETKKHETKESKEPSEYESKQICEQYKKAWDYYSTIRNSFEEKEEFIFGAVNDSVSAKTKSKVNDPKLMTQVMERSFRVMAQLASGKVQALTKKDLGKSMFMDMVIHKYVIPNANSQYDILTKFRQVDFYSGVFGSYGVLVDYMVKEDYIGPDFMLIPIRDLIPQPGRISINDCEYVFVKTKVSRNWLLNRDVKTWKNIDKLMEAMKAQSPNLKDANLEQQSYAERVFGGDFSESVSKFKEVTLVTRYERDRWVTIAPDHNLILRDIPNPHKNGKIPVVVKSAFPLADRFFGLGEFERGATLQWGINSAINLYLDGAKFAMLPPMKIDVNDVVLSTIKNEPAAKWVMRNGNMNAVQPYNTGNAQSLQAFQSTYQALTSALLNMSGTTDVSTADGIDPALGKTPQAIAFLSQRQNARDSFDRFMMEKFVEEVYNLFLDLIVNKQEKPIKLVLFEKEIEKIQQYSEDVLDLFESGKAGELVIKPEEIKDTSYKFYIDAGSTYKKDELLAKQEVDAQLALLLKMPGAAESIMQTGGVQMGNTFVDFTELYKRSLIGGGIQDWEKIIKDQPAQAQPEGQGMQPQVGPDGQPMGGQQMNAEDQKFQAILASIMNGPFAGGQGGNSNTNTAPSIGL